MVKWISHFSSKEVLQVRILLGILKTMNKSKPINNHFTKLDGKPIFNKYALESCPNKRPSVYSKEFYKVKPSPQLTINNTK